jgi:hypothetical protein
MHETAEGKFETVLSVTGPATLDVSVDSGLIRVRAGESGSVRIRGTLRARRTFFGWGGVEDRIRQLESAPPVEQDGDTIRVGDVANRWLLRGVTLFLEIAVPADTRVRTLADSGDIRVEGVNGQVDCEADSGDVEVFSVDANVRATSDAGTIRIREVTGRVFASTDSGDIEARDVLGDVEVSTDSGEIRIAQAIAMPVRAESDSGGITVRLAAEGGYNISIQTDHGQISTPGLEYREPPTHQEVRGSIRGGETVVDLTTDSGDIDIA